MKNNVQEIYKILNLPDVFTRLEMNTSQLATVEHLLTPFLEDCQNNSPTVKRFLELSEQYNAVLECYIVNTDRDDTRFSIEGVSFTHLAKDDIIS